MNPIVDMQSVNYLSLKGMDIYSIIGTCLSHVATDIAVPCFFMFSGFLFFYKIDKWNKSIYIKKIKSRFFTLIIPYILWNLIPIMIDAAITLIKKDGNVLIFFNDLYDKGLWHIFWNCSEWAGTNTNVLGWPIPNYGPYLLPMWFLKELIVMVFLTPFIYYFIKYTKLYGILLVGIFYYTRIGFVMPGFSTYLFLLALFFFSLGAYFSIHGKNLVLSLRKGQYFWGLLAIISMVLSTIYDSREIREYFIPLYEISGVITAVNITSFFMERNQLKVSNYLSKASFFVYAIHAILILRWTIKLFDKVFNSENIIVLFIRYFSIPFICVCICMTIYYLMQRFTPKILNLLTGNRG
ncbi:hypothetical protein FACS189413_12190 [Bacteroidia bacterium]|nr:hypothetical protein FACS189413_12190 [Bacteroidia bacterium]